MVGLLRQDAPTTWIDDVGREWSTPTAPRRLKWRHPLHWHLRAFVFRRDGFTCQDCGRAVRRPPTTYTGRRCLPVFGRPRRLLLVDHIIALKNGGSNHPLNLRACCEDCNWRKAGAVDGQAWRRGAA